MTSSVPLRRRLDARRWAIAQAPGLLVFVMLSVEIVPIVWIAATVRFSAHTAQGLLLAAFLAFVALTFEECVTRTSRLQLRFGPTLKRDMTSVWAVTGAAALSPVAGAALLTTIHTYVWFRQQRPAGEQLYRKVLNCANNVTSSMVASVAATSVAGLHGLPGAVPRTLSIIAAIVVFALVNRLIITIVLLSIGTAPQELLGSREDNLIELATLCLGGLVAATVLVQPLLAMLVIAPMVTLQRGAGTRALEAAATTDAKTGLLNAVAWEQIATRELLLAAQKGTEIAVLIIDVDHFKRVNDRHGHLVGDKVLRRLARSLSSGMREFDTVARFGGEEFVAVLPATSSAEAAVVAERVRARINDIWMSTIIEGLDTVDDSRLAVSIGVATAPMDGVELTDLLRAADGALYRAKDAGRNRVVLADRGPGRAAQTLPFA